MDVLKESCTMSCHVVASVLLSDLDWKNVLLFQQSVSNFPHPTRRGGKNFFFSPSQETVRQTDRYYWYVLLERGDRVCLEADVPVSKAPGEVPG